MCRPTIDVVIPMSHMWLMPYLRNCVRAIKWQQYPPERINIIVGLMYSEDEDISELARFAKRSEATLVFRKLKDPAFNISRTKNVCARSGSGQCIAFIDVDVVLHPKTFSLAAPFLTDGISTIIPVGRMEQPPDDIVYSLTGVDWEKHTKDAPFRRDGVGNIITPRETLEMLRGYDERFHGWGGPDTDIQKRHRIAGKEMVNLIDHGCLKAMHQNHPITPTRESSFTKRNRAILTQSHGAIRNPNRWGDIVDSD